MSAIDSLCATLFLWWEFGYTFARFYFIFKKICNHWSLFELICLAFTCVKSFVYLFLVRKTTSNAECHEGTANVYAAGRSKGDVLLAGFILWSCYTRHACWVCRLNRQIKCIFLKWWAEQIIIHSKYFVIAHWFQSLG